jgi:hypothetical protein
MAVAEETLATAMVVAVVVVAVVVAEVYPYHETQS